MAKYVVMYNPLSDNGRGQANCEPLKKRMPEDEFEFVDITGIQSYREFFSGYGDDVRFVIAGGDGTLNHFVNGDGVDCRNVWYFPGGSGNDFYRDVGDLGQGKPFELTPYLKHLPEVTIKGKSWRFINGVGYGIDGYCCEQGDIQRSKSHRRVNYTTIALKGLLYDYKPQHARVTVDGVEHEFDRVWMAPTMNGRYFGGGMMVTPDQHRLNDDHHVSLMLAHDMSRMRILHLFLYIFGGTHVRYKGEVDIFTGHEISVAYDNPCAMQVDGETVTAVSSYTVRASK